MSFSFKQTVLIVGLGLAFAVSAAGAANAQERVPLPNQVYVFEDVDYSGASAQWNIGQSVPDLRRWNTPAGKSWNDRISSIRVGANARMLGYENINFGGKCIIFAGTSAGGRGDYNNLTYNMGDNWNDRISSLKVVNASTRC